MIHETETLFFAFWYRVPWGACRGSRSFSCARGPCTTHRHGYVTRDIPAGFSLQVVPVLNRNSHIAALIKEAPEGTEIVIDDGSGWIINRFGNLAWSLPDMQLQMGRGMIFNSPEDWSITWVGDVLAGDLGSLIPEGESLVGSLIPKEGKLGRDLAFPLMEGVEILTVNREGGDFESLARVENGAWVPMDPPISVGEAVVVRAPEAFM